MPVKNPFTPNRPPRTLRVPSSRPTRAMSARVVIVGSYVQDLAFYVENFPRPGDSVLAELRPGSGGKGFNQAVAATRAGAPTLFIGAIGQDAAGAGAREFVRKAGVHAEFITKKKEPTGAASIAVNS